MTQRIFKSNITINYEKVIFSIEIAINRNINRPNRMGMVWEWYGNRIVAQQYHDSGSHKRQIQLRRTGKLCNENSSLIENT